MTGADGDPVTVDESSCAAEDCGSCHAPTSHAPSASEQRRSGLHKRNAKQHARQSQQKRPQHAGEHGLGREADAKHQKGDVEEPQGIGARNFQGVGQGRGPGRGLLTQNRVLQG